MNRKKSLKEQSFQLVRAAEKGDVGRLVRLIEDGADVNKPCFDEFFPLFSAAARGRVDAVKFLLAKGADPNLQYLAQEEDEGATALAMACRKGHGEIIELLLKGGANVNALSDDPDVPTPLQYAVLGNHSDVIRRLLSLGARPNEAAISRAIRNGYIDALREMLKNRQPEEIPFRPTSVATAVPLEAKHSERQLEILKLIIEAGAKVDAEDENGFTALYQAVKKNCPKVAKFLVGVGADTNKRLGVIKETALHEAASRGHCECAKVLIKAGAKVDLKNILGKTPLNFAKYNKHKEMVELLQ